MLPASWKSVVRFVRREFDDPRFPGSGIHIAARSVLLLDKLALTNNFRVMTNWRRGGCVDMKGSHGHSKRSYHRYDMGCSAVDFYLLDINYNPLKINLRHQFNLICQAGFACVIVYPWWNNPGFHIDDRPIDRANYLYSPKFKVYEALFP